MLKDAWDDLHQKSPHKSIYSSFEWVYTWWKYLGKGQLLTLVAENIGKVHCIAPLMIVQDFFLGVGYKRLKFIGTDATETYSQSYVNRLLSIDLRYGWSDSVDFIYDPEKIEALDKIIEYLANKDKWDILDLREMNSASGSIQILEKWFGNKVVVTEKRIGSLVYGINTTGGFDAYISAFNRKERERFRQVTNRIKKLSNIELHIYKEHDHIAEKLPAIIELEHKSWKGSENAGAFSRTDNMNFHVNLAKNMAQRGRFILFTLEKENKIVIYFYTFQFGNILYLHNTAMSPDLRYYSLGFNLMFKVIEYACKEDIKIILLGKGPDKFKRAFKPYEEYLVWITIYRKKILMRILHFIQFRFAPFVKSIVGKDKAFISIAGKKHA